MENGEISKAEAAQDEIALAKQKVEDIFSSDRGERAYFMAAPADQPVRLPITRDGLDAFLERAAGYFNPPLPLDDSAKTVVAGFVAHLDREVHVTTIQKVAEVIYKAMANKFTWTVDQEVKIEQQKKLDAARAAAQKKADAEKIAKAEEKRDRKTAKRVTVSKSGNEALS